MDFMSKQMTTTNGKFSNNKNNLITLFDDQTSLHFDKAISFTVIFKYYVNSSTKCNLYCKMSLFFLNQPILDID